MLEICIDLSGLLYLCIKYNTKNLKGNIIEKLTITYSQNNKIILEVNPSEVVAGCQYVGMFEENMTKLMKLCEKYNILLFAYYNILHIFLNILLYYIQE